MMGYKARYILPLVILLEGGGSSSGWGQANSIIYQSPLPNAKYITPQKSIIIRTPSFIDPQSLTFPDLFTVSGSFSGEHSGQVILSDDQRTVIFKPDRVFAVQETVTVALHSGLRTMTGEIVEPTVFDFFIGGSREPTRSRSWQDLMGFAPPQWTSMHPASPGPVVSRTDTLPQDFPYIHTVVSGPTAPGRIFLCNLQFGVTDNPYLLIFENDGTPVFYRKMDAVCFDFKLQPNGLLTYFNQRHEVFYVLDSSYTIIDSYRCGDGYVTDTHDLRLLPNGHALMMSYDPERVDMSQIVSGGSSAATVEGLVVQELDRARNVVFQWRSWDHFQITDATHENLQSTRIDYVHGNAIDLDTDGDLLISSRHLDEITKIDRETGRVVWRLGGKHNQFTLLNDSIWFSHQHAVRRLANGHIMLFDNGNYHTPPFSRAVEYALDEVTMIATKVWEYRNVPDTTFGWAMGYAERLPNGNTLIGWGATNPTVTEVAPDGSKLFEMTFDPGVFSYRAYRAEWNPDSVAPPPTVPLSITLGQNYPNPFNGTTTISISTTRSLEMTLRLYDVLGREVRTLVDRRARSPGFYREVVDAEGLATGIYFYRLTAGGSFQTRKMMIIR